jgi:hypothetical protein
MPFDERLQPITEEGDLDYVLDLFVHTNVGSMSKPFVCPYENFGESCPICEFIKSNRLEKEDWKKLVAKHRVVYFIWVHDSREEERKGIQIFEASHFFMQEKIEEIAKLPRGGGSVDFSNYDEGKSLAWTRKGSGVSNTQYLGHRFVERDRPIPDKILDMTFPLDSIVNMHPSYEEIEKEFRGTLSKMNLGDTEETPFDEDNTPFDEDNTPFDDETTGDSMFDDAPKKIRKKKKVRRKRVTSRKRR